MKRTIFLMMVILMASLTSAVSSININYDFNSTNYSYGVYSSSSILLIVNTTPQETNCYYTSVAEQIPRNLFDENYGTSHEQTLNNLEDGLQKYYIQCEGTPPSLMEISFRINSPISGEIHLPTDNPLKAGIYDIDLTTSKVAIETPSLKYSFDGINYNTIALAGSGKNWEGYLIIEKDLENSVGSFIFEAKDLTGLKGTELKGNKIFLVDTIKPATISSIEIIGDTGQINLKWFYEEEHKEFNIYKLEDPNVGYIDFYKTTKKKEFIDNEVTKGKTYYYRIAAIDQAGNIGDISREISATALFSDTETSTGLRTELLGKVDNFLSEITASTQEVTSIKNSLYSKEQKEKDLFLLLKLDKELDNANAQLGSLKKEVELYKNQDLTKEELDNKLSSASLKLSIIKKVIPEKIMISEEMQFSQSVSDENIQQALLLENPLIEEKNYEESISLTKEMIKDTGIKISTTSYALEAFYLDGTRKEFTIIEHSIDSLLEKTEDIFLVLSIPNSVAGKTSELNIKNINYASLKENSLSFSSDTKKISYYLPKEIPLEQTQEITLIPIKIKESQEKTNSITGGFLMNSSPSVSYGIIIGIIFFILLGIYLIYSKKNKDSEIIAPLLEKIEKMNSLKKEGNIKEIFSTYDSIKEDYKRLNERQKEKIFEEIEKLKEILAKKEE